MNRLSVVCLVYCALVHNAANADYSHYNNRIQRVHKSRLRQGSATVQAVQKALEDLRQRVIAGDPNYPLDPMFVPSIGPINYDAGVVTVGILLSNLKLEGLSKFSTQNVVVDTASHIATIKTTLPTISLAGNYYATGPSFVSTEPATGSFHALLTNVDASLQIAYSHSNPGHVQLSELTISLAPGSTQIQLGNYGGSITFNNLINEYLQEAATINLQDELPTIVAEVTKIASPILSKFLGEYNFGNVPIRTFTAILL